MPSTSTGKVLTIIYSGFGIAMCLSTFIKFGNVIAITTHNTYVLVKFHITRAFRAQRSRPPAPASQLKDVSTTFLLVLNIVYIFLGAALLDYYNDLSFLDCYYFLVITMSTIGFGDIYPDRRNQILCIGLTCFGLGLMATLFTKLRKFIQHHIEVKLMRYLMLKKRSFKQKLSILPEKVGLPDRSINSMVTYVSTRSKGQETAISWSDYGEQAYVVDFERCLVM